MGVDLEDLRGKEMGMLVSLGEEKVVPMISAIRGGYVTHLVTGQSAARRLLDMAAAEAA